jgi:viroplasmin and RNaseH domain-containing protein
MSKKYYYAVKVGKVTGIFETWEECKDSVNGYPNAQYKKFTDRKQAENYLNDIDEEEIIVEEAKENNTLIAYVDGSFNEEIGRYSYGIVIILPNGDIYEASGYGDDKRAIASRNIAGEVKGVMHLIDYMNRKSYESAIIRYDYEGIEYWATKKWKPNSYVAKEYVKFMDSNAKGLKLKFEKVKSHSNNKYNDKADKLAKKALLEGIDIKQVKKEGDHYIVIEGIKSIDEIETIIDVMKDEYSIDCSFKRNIDKCIFDLTSGEDKIVVTYYDNKNKLLIQGHKNNIYSVFISYLGVLVDTTKLIPVLNEYYNLSIDQEQLDHQFILYLPSVNKDLIEEKRKTVLYQAIFNLNIRGNMPEYTFLAHPILRLAEAYIKDIRDKVAPQNIPPSNLFDKNQMDIYSLKDYYKRKLVDKDKITLFNRLYNYYCQERNRLFHWDDMKINLDTTKIITDHREIVKIIKKGLELINRYYELY